ncbi:MAG: hypothetical protein U0Q16_14540 [Bryobacteraceae bacterium]
MAQAKELILRDLHERHPGLTWALGECFAEAAQVCYARYHEPPVELLLDCDGTAEAGQLDFPVPGERLRRAHANEIDATELGAYGISLAALEAVSGLVAIKRAETLTGADWYVAPVGADLDDLELCLRLEVAGVGAGNRNDIRRKLVEKVDQAARGRSNLPAIASVVGFRALQIAIRTVGEHQ